MPAVLSEPAVGVVAVTQSRARAVDVSPGRWSRATIVVGLAIDPLVEIGAWCAIMDWTESALREAGLDVD